VGSWGFSQVLDEDYRRLEWRMKDWQDGLEEKTLPQIPREAALRRVELVGYGIFGALLETVPASLAAWCI